MAHVLRQHSEWVLLLYAAAVSWLFAHVLPYTPANTALLTISIGLPLIFGRVRRNTYLPPPAIVGGVLVVIGAVWLVVLALRAG